MAGPTWQERQQALDAGYQQLEGERQRWLPRLERMYREKVADDRSWFLWGVQREFQEKLDVEKVRQENALALQQGKQTGAETQIRLRGEQARETLGRGAELETAATAGERERYKTEIGEPAAEAFGLDVVPQSDKQLEEFRRLNAAVLDIQKGEIQEQQIKDLREFLMKRATDMGQNPEIFQYIEDARLGAFGEAFLKPKAEPKPKAPPTAQQTRQDIEKRMDRIRAEIKRLAKWMEEPETQEDEAALARGTATQEKYQAELDRLRKEWEGVAFQPEAYDAATAEEEIIRRAKAGDQAAQKAAAQMGLKWQ